MRYREINPNPVGKRVGDCAVRAVALATNQSWDEAYIELCVLGLKMGDMPNANAVWGMFLKKQGFKKSAVIPDDEPTTIEKFCEEHKRGTFVIAVSEHVVCVKDGYYLDAWDSGQCVPLYYWYRED